MKTIKIGLVATLIASLVGCASIAGDNTRAVRVTSKPAGAAIFVDNQRYGTTPATITMPTYIYGGKSITLKKKGYHPTTMRVNSKFQPIALLDIFAPVTFLIDAGTGNLVKIDPANLDLSTRLTARA